MKNKIIFKTLMLKGEAGSTIVSMEKTGHSGTTDTYTITFDDGSTTDIYVENMSSIESIELTSQTDEYDTYTVTLADGSTQTFSVANHNADIAAIQAALNSDIADISAELDNQSALLNARIDTFTSLAEGSTTGDAELADIRVGYNGKTYESAGSAVRTQISDIREEIDLNGYILLSENDLQQGEWINGSISSTTSRLCTKVLYDVLAGMTIKHTTGTGIKIAVVVFDENGNKLEDTGQVASETETTYTIKHNGKMGLTFQRVGGSYMNAAYYTTSGAITKLGITIGERVNILSDMAVNANNSIAKTESIGDLTPIDLGYSAAWEKGSISSSGENTSGNTIIRTASYLDIGDFTVIDFKINSGYKFGWHFYDSSKTHISSSPDGYITSNLKMNVPANAKYLRVNMGDTAGSDADITWNQYIEINGYLKIVAKVLDLDNAIAGDIGSGSNAYSGNKIDLHKKNKTCYCNVSLWKKYTSAEFPSLADYHLNSNQAIAIHGDYVFLFNSGGTIAIADFNTKALIEFVELPLTNRNHQNSAQFSDIYYDAVDEFPLLFISRCGNSSSGSGDDTCLVYRIVRNNTDFTFSLINTISCDIETHGNSWFIDVNEKSIGFAGFVNDTYDVETNNPIVLYKWRMPSEASIISGNTISLSASNVISHAEIGHHGLQGACAFGGIVYLGIGLGNDVEYVYAVDMIKGYTVSVVPLLSTLEVEGVTVFDGKMYVTHRKASDSSGVEPLLIYEIDFT